MKFGKIKFFAYRYLAGQPIPLFTDNKINRAITEFSKKIRQARTKRAKA